MLFYTVLVLCFCYSLWPSIYIYYYEGGCSHNYIIAVAFSPFANPPFYPTLLETSQNRDVV